MGLRRIAGSPGIQAMGDEKKVSPAASSELTRKRKRPRLRTVLLLVNLVILLLPLAGIGVLRVYESELVRVTETSLIAQGAIIAAAYRELILRELHDPPMGLPQLRAAEYGIPLNPKLRRRYDPNKPVRAIPPKLDLATEPLRPPAPDGKPPEKPPDPYAVIAGRSITPMLKAGRSVTLAGIRVMDYRGTVVASSGADLGLSLAHRLDVALALNGHPASLIRERVLDQPTPSLKSLSRGARKRVFVSMPIVADYRIVGVVSLSRTPMDVAKALYLKRYHILLGGAVILAAMLLVSFFTAMMISRPVEELIEQSERVTRGDETAAVPLENPRILEVEKLSRAFASMAATLQKRAEQMRVFASNVSHGFKTPLTSIRGAIELLQDHFDDMPRPERERFLKLLDEETTRLQRLVTRLLELARAETVNPKRESTPVSSAVRTIVQRYADNGLNIDLLNHAGETNADMSPDTFESILTNLLDNARQHGGEGVGVTIECRRLDRGGDDLVEIIVSDDGKGPPGDGDGIFQPFFTTAGNSGGTGLGLTMVKALLEAHGGSIELLPSPAGCRFRLELPVKG